jgi:hypothetical protein
VISSQKLQPLNISDRDYFKAHASERTLAQYPLAVVVGTSQAEVLAEYSQNRLRYYCAAVILSVIVALFSFLLMLALRRKNRALEALSASETQFRTRLIRPNRRRASWPDRRRAPSRPTLTRDVGCRAVLSYGALLARPRPCAWLVQRG